MLIKADRDKQNLSRRIFRGALLFVALFAMMSSVLSTPVAAVTQNDVSSIINNTSYYDKDDPGSCTSADSSGTTTAATGSSLPPESEKEFEQIKPAIDKLQSVYQQAGQAKGVPWQMLAAIHHREGGNNPNSSLLDGSPLGTPNKDHPELAPKTLEESAELAADYLKGLADSVYGVKVGDSNSFEDLQKAFLAYNRGSLYKTAGVSPDKSPYVMNGYDAQHMHMSWTDPPDTVSGTDGDPLGALTVYSALVGDISSSGNGGECTASDGTATGSSGGLGISSDGFVFPEITTQAAIKKGSGFVWCYTSHTSCHHDYWAADIANLEGTTVVAAKSGTVVIATDPGSCSGFDVPRVHIKADDGLFYYYTHMKVGSLVVRSGQKIKAGDPIGKIGPSQCAEGASPHLHFQVTHQIINDTGNMSGEFYCTGGADHLGKINGDPCRGNKIPFNLNPQPPLIEAFNKLPEK